MEENKVNMNNAPAVQNDAAKTDNDSELGFKFFKNCSASLKRFSIILFVINIFISISVCVIGSVFLEVYVGLNLFLALIFPIVCLMIILCIIARFISAVIYGFAEIVEKYEK